MTLALVIPVHNDAARLTPLLHQAERLGCFDQVVIADDGSERPVTEGAVPPGLRDRTVLLRSETPGGAGQARNRALAEVSADHLLFFDADDHLTTELPRLWRELQGRDFDFCLFRHHDSRVLSRGGLGPMPLDAALWRLAGTGAGGLRPVAGQALADLAETANYPWNKLYRTGFLHEHGLQFTEIPVHNDIAMHWDSFSCARAGQVLVSDRAAAVHFVAPGGQRLTNRRSEERLQVFEPLDHVRAGIRTRQGGRSALMLALIRFSCGLMDWVRGNIDTELRPRFDRRAGAFLEDLLERGAALNWLERADPVLALRLLLLLARSREAG